ncbi:MAG: hypothetical protein ACREMB_03590, partial [Candidatus Rokuibacteriota bacterium]
GVLWLAALLTAAAPADGAPSVGAGRGGSGGAGDARLDLAALENRLRDTQAIGFFTKLSLKNQVDDLVADFRRFHQGRSQARLAQLKERFNLLLMKVLSLLQDRDPGLAHDVAASRDRLWHVLADRGEFRRVVDETEGG